jgi:hypothetical protein
MVSDEELAAHVRRAEQDRTAPEPRLTERLDRMQSTARCVHDELARRVERVDATTADAEALDDLVDRIERLETRLEEVESRLD